jgi:hypothetical protein
LEKRIKQCDNTNQEAEQNQRKFSENTSASLNLPIQSFYASAECAHNLAYSSDLIKLKLKLVNLSQDLMEARNFGVGHLNCIAGAVVLYLGGNLCLRG